MKGKALCVAFIISCGITIVMLLCTALLMYYAKMGETGMTIMVLCTYLVSNFAAGFFIGKCVESRRFLWGIVTAHIYFLFFILLSLGAGNEGNIGIGNWLITYAVIVTSGMFGGMIA